MIWLLLSTLVHGAMNEASSRQSPNILFVLCDDLGYGDVGAFNPGSKIATPNLDKFASEGMSFRDAHSSSSVCTPTRYGIITGRYCWRTKLKSGVLQGFSARLIERDKLTVPLLLKQNGYKTACIGKWHLGMDWPLKEGGLAADYPDQWKVDYSKPIANGPTTVGFDTYFGISASLDMPPFVFIRNDRTVGIPTVEKNWVRKGAAVADFDAIDVQPVLANEAIACLNENAKSKDKPFFLYLPLAAPHAPIVPTDEWKGKSGLNVYGDFVMQVDQSIGEILKALEKNGQTENTMVIITSDNGCSPVANIEELIAKGHHPSAQFRGNKADIFEGGHRVPFLVRWPGMIKPGTHSDRLVGLNDLMATCAELLGATLPDNAGEDSVSWLPTALGKEQPARSPLINHSINGAFAIRDGSWKLAFCPDSGGWSKPRPGVDNTTDLPLIQLYNLETDVAETKNLQADRPEVVARLTATMEDFITRGRSTPGAIQQNDGKIIYRKPRADPAKTKAKAQAKVKAGT